MTSYQRKLLDSVDCLYNREEGVLWGPYKLPDGRVKVVCRCTKLDCKYLLTSCRRYETKESIEKEIALRQELRQQGSMAKEIHGEAIDRTESKDVPAISATSEPPKGTEPTTTPEPPKGAKSQTSPEHQKEPEPQTKPDLPKG